MNLGPVGNNGMECPNFCEDICGPEEMLCPGGMDDNNCKMPDFCIPTVGPIDKAGKVFYNGNQCSNTCPLKCGPDNSKCGGEIDARTGCKNPEWCLPIEGMFYTLSP